VVVVAVDRVEAEVAGAARRAPCIVALGHMVGAGSIESQEPAGICMVLDLLAPRGEPGQRLDEVAVNENHGVGVDGLPRGSQWSRLESQGASTRLIRCSSCGLADIRPCKSQQYTMMLCTVK
jgi:hypothetical protein